MDELYKIVSKIEGSLEITCNDYKTVYADPSTGQILLMRQKIFGRCGFIRKRRFPSTKLLPTISSL